MALNKVEATSTRVVLIAKERKGVAIKCDTIRLCVEHSMVIENEESARLEAYVVKVTQEGNANGGKAKQLSLEVQCVLVPAKKAKNLRERVSAFEASARPKALKVDKSPETRSKQKKAEVEPESEQVYVEFDLKMSMWRNRKPL